MAKTKKNEDGKNPTNMLGQKTGSMLDKKTNEDFNNVHPDHDDSGLIDDGSISDDKNISTNAKQITGKKKPETNLKNTKQ